MASKPAKPAPVVHKLSEVEHLATGHMSDAEKLDLILERLLQQDDKLQNLTQAQSRLERRFARYIQRKA